MVNYQKNLIYKLVCKNLDVKETHTGHTTDFTRRKSEHKYCCNNDKAKKNNLKVYNMMRENGGWENWDMIEIEKFPCNDANEATARERFYYELLNPTMNSQIPNRTQTEYNKQYCDEHIDKIQEKSKQYREDSKEKIKESYRKWYLKKKAEAEV